MATSISRFPSFPKPQTGGESARAWFDALSRPNERCLFWADESRWPRDPSGFSFLARAVHQIGKAMFPLDWSGTEPITMAPPTYVKDNGALASPISAYYAKALLDGSSSEFSAALADIKRRNSELKPIFDRLAAVHECIIIRAESGELETAVRKPGGEMHHLPPRIWNGRVEQRFFWCQMSVREPFGLAVGGDAFDWIFIPRGSLDKLLRSLGEPSLADVAVPLEPEPAMAAVRKKLSLDPLKRRRLRFSLSPLSSQLVARLPTMHPLNRHPRPVHYENSARIN